MVSVVYSGHGTLVASSTTAMAWGRVPRVNCKGTNFWKAWSLCCFPTTREAPAELPESHFNLQGGKSNLDRDRKATEDPTWGARVRQV